MPGEKVIKYAIYLLGIFILAALSYFRIFESFELQTLDLRFKLRPALKSSPDIAIIEIAEDSLNELGAWPFDRGYHAALIDCLRQVGAKAVVFDILFSEETANDEEFIAAVQRAKGLVYFPVSFRLDEGEVKEPLRAQAMEGLLIEGLAKSAKGIGHINIITDIDGKRRRAPLFIEYEGKNYPQLGFLVARDYLGGERLQVPQGPDGTILINYAGRWTGTFKHYSFIDVLRSYYQAVVGERAVLDIGEFYNKVCFVGVTAVGAHDLSSVPLEPRYPMVGVHANVFNSIIQNKFLFRANKLVNLAILIALCIIIAIIVKGVRPLLGLGMSLIMILLFITISVVLFILFGIWVDLFYPVVLAFGIYLGGTFNKYLAEQRVRLLLDKELSIAKKIQLDFLPQSVPQINDLEIAASISTAKAVGGDLYDFVRVDSGGEGRLGIMIGDVSGKGVPAALFMARSIADFRHYANRKDLPSSVLNELNAQIALNYKSEVFITMFYIIYDSSKRALIYSNAGHLPAIWLRAEGGIEFFTTEGMPLGLVDTEKYSDAELRPKSGDTIVLYTDGITEARNQNKEEFTSERLKDVVLRNKGASPQAMVDAIKAELNRFVGLTPQYDDYTLLILKVY